MKIKDIEVVTEQLSYINEVISRINQVELETLTSEQVNQMTLLKLNHQLCMMRLDLGYITKEEVELVYDLANEIDVD